MALAVFHKHLNKIEISSKGVSGKPDLFNCLLNCLLPIGSCYSLVEEKQLLFPCGRTVAALMTPCGPYWPGMQVF